MQREFTIPTDMQSNKSPVHNHDRRDSQRRVVHPPFMLRLGAGLYEDGGFGIGKQGVLESLQGGFVVEIDTNEHELRARSYAVGGPQ